MIAIIDYGMGNIHSVQKALESFGQETSVISYPKKLKDGDKIVLPGVGAFDDAILELKKKGFDTFLKQELNSKRTLLGICLGMQLLFERSQEARQEKGLGLLAGEVRRFDPRQVKKIPHIGWNQLKITKPSTRESDCPLLRGLAADPCVYFCHSYYVAPADKKTIEATCEYGFEFAAVVSKDNLYGVQFHPEKSQEEGLAILKNFVELC